MICLLVTRKVEIMFKRLAVILAIGSTWAISPAHAETYYGYFACTEGTLGCTKAGYTFGEIANLSLAECLAYKQEAETEWGLPGLCF